MIKHPFFFLFFLTCFTCASAQTFTMAADREKILVGERFHLHVIGSFKKGAVSWLKLDSVMHFEILERGSIDSQDKGTSIQLSQIFTLTSWDSGKWQIQLPVPNAKAIKPVFVDVAFSPHPFDVNQPYHPVKDILEVKKPVTSKWYWYLIFAGILIALFLLFFPREKKKKVEGFVVDEGAYKKALRKLEQLREEKGIDPKVFYTELIYIFRDYLQRKKNIHSFSKTTDDLVVQMNGLDLPKEIFAELVQTLRLGDLVKFAKYQPESKENSEALEIIRDSIITIEQVPHAV